MPPGDYDDAHPSEAWLIIEVADSSLTKDRGIKSAVYAKCGVPEYYHPGDALKYAVFPVLRRLPCEKEVHFESCGSPT